MDDVVTIICNGIEQSYERRDALEIFFERMLGGETSEIRERAYNIYKQLFWGEVICSDKILY